MQRLLLALALSFHLLTTTPAQAQSTAPAGLWQSLTSSTSEAMQNYVWGPLQNVTQGLFASEQSFTSHLNAFRQTLRTDVRRIEVLAGRAGYRLNTITMNPGILPAVSVTFGFVGKISPADEATLRAEMAALTGLSGVLERGIILGLLDLEKNVESFRPDGFRIAEVEMALVAIFPEISVSFTRGE